MQRSREGYWDGHLSVVYDGNDPTQVEVSFGNYQGSARQFAVVGNAPDPATVGPGPVRRVADFPTGSSRLTADAPTGMTHTLVNGVPIRLDGTPVVDENYYVLVRRQ